MIPRGLRHAAAHYAKPGRELKTPVTRIRWAGGRCRRHRRRHRHRRVAVIALRPIIARLCLHAAPAGRGLQGIKTCRRDPPEDRLRFKKKLFPRDDGVLRMRRDEAADTAT